MSTINIKFEITKYPYHGGSLRNALIKIRGNRCEKCGLTQWQNQPIPLEAHHIDGNKCNNTLENLQLLCPNCHTLTSNYGSKNNQKIKTKISDEELIQALQMHSSIRQALFSLGMSDAGANYERARVLIQNNPTQNILIERQFQQKLCPDCGKIITSTAQRCSECASKASRVVERPEREIFKEEVYTTSFTQLGKKYKVSDTSIKKWCIYYNLPYKRSEIKQYSKEEWMQL